MELVTKFLSFVISKLPQSPFVSFIDALADISFLSHLNYLSQSQPLLELVRPGLLRLVCFIFIQ